MITPAFPDTPASDWSITGGSESGGIVTASSTSVSISRDVWPLFVAGSAGVLTWAASVEATGGEVTEVTFRLTSAGIRRSVTRVAVPASAVLAAPVGDAAVTLKLSIDCEVGTEIAVTEAWSQQPQVVVPLQLAEDGFGDISPNGVMPPPPSAALPAREALSAGRRSPQIRAAQLLGSSRPDLLDRQSSLT